MRVFAVGCHPDDLEIGCFGTLAKYVKQGHEVAVCHVANGNMGHAEIMPEPLRQMRLKEAEEAAKVIGAAHYSIDIPDLYVTADNDALVMKLGRLMRDVQPDLIITHFEHDYMNDHIQTYHAVMRASFTASLAHYDPDMMGKTAAICPIYHMDTLAGVGFIPTEYVDITDEIDTKLEALNCHRSQIDWMRDHDKVDFLNMVRSCSRVRGIQSGVQYAEGFRPNINYLRLSTKRLLP